MKEEILTNIILAAVAIVLVAVLVWSFVSYVKSGVEDDITRDDDLKDLYEGKETRNETEN